MKQSVQIPNLKRQIAIGAVWLVGGRVLIRLIGLLSTMILARLLLPEDFGLIALAMSVVAVLDVMSAFSFDLALIADQNASRADYDTAWTMALIKGLFGLGVLLGLAGPAAWYFGDQRLIPVFQVLALYILLRGIENVGIVDFRRDLTFDKEFRFNLYLKLFGFFSTISAAYLLRDYRALLIGIMAQALARVLLSYTMSPYRPRWALERWRPIMRFSKWILLNNLLIFLNQRSATFIIGKLQGITATGFFSLAEEISNLATTELASPIQRAVFPGYAKVAGTIDRLRTGYFEVLGITMMLALPISAAISVNAERIVLVFLGEKWADIVPLVSLMTIAGAISLCGANSGSVFMAAGRPRIIAINAGVLALVRIPALLYAISSWGSVGAAYALIGSSVVVLMANWLAVAFILGFSFFLIPARNWRPVLAAIFMGITMHWADPMLGTAINLRENICHLALLIAIGGAAYITAVVLMWLARGRPDGTEMQIQRAILT